MSRVHTVIDLTGRPGKSMPSPLHLDFDRDDNWQHIWTLHFGDFEIRTSLEVLEHIVDQVKTIAKRDGLYQ